MELPASVVRLRDMGVELVAAEEGATSAADGHDAVDVSLTGQTRLTVDEEFTCFVRSHSARLSSIALLICGDRTLAEDLVQEALTRTYFAWSRGAVDNPFGYARRTIANLRVDTWRRRRREVLMEARDINSPSVAGHEQAVAEALDLLRALAALSLKQRRVVVLRYAVGLTEAEVADELGIPVGTVKSSARRALALLEQRLSASEASGVSGKGSGE